MTIQWIRDTENNTATIARLGTRGTLSKDVSYVVLGATSEDQIHLAANAYISANVPTWSYPNNPLVSLLAQGYDVEYLGDDAWRVTVHYERQGADDDRRQLPIKRARSFDTAGGTEHKTQCIRGAGNVVPLRKWKASGEDPFFSDDETAIGFDGEQVHGVDIIAPALQWTEQYDVPSNYVTAAYIKSVAALTGTVNIASFRTFAAGEVLFAGCQGSQQWDSEAGDGPWSLTYKFIAMPNAGSGQTLPALQIGDIDGIVKRGHDYLWVRYSRQVQGNTVLPKAEAVYVGKVYRDGNFAGLGIGQ